MNNTNNDKNRQCNFVNAFEILIKNIIIPYFIASNQYSNHSIELCNLMVCCRSIKKVFGQNFKSRIMYYINNTIELKGLEFVKNITFGGDFNPSGLLRLKPNTLPESLISLTFGEEFNQPLEKD